MKSIKKRWFVLSDDGILRYSKDKGTKELGRIDLKRLRVQEVVESKKQISDKRMKYCFELRTPQRCYFFFTNDEVEKWSWIKALQEKIAQLKAATSSQPNRKLRFNWPQPSGKAIVYEWKGNSSSKVVPNLTHPSRSTLRWWTEGDAIHMAQTEFTIKAGNDYLPLEEVLQAAKSKGYTVQFVVNRDGSFRRPVDLDNQVKNATDIVKETDTDKSEVLDSFTLGQNEFLKKSVETEFLERWAVWVGLVNGTDLHSEFTVSTNESRGIQCVQMSFLTMLTEDQFLKHMHNSLPQLLGGDVGDDAFKNLEGGAKRALTEGSWEIETLRPHSVTKMEMLHYVLYGELVVKTSIQSFVFEWEDLPPVNIQDHQSSIISKYKELLTEIYGEQELIEDSVAVAENWADLEKYFFQEVLETIEVGTLDDLRAVQLCFNFINACWDMFVSHTGGSDQTLNNEMLREVLGKMNGKKIADEIWQSFILRVDTDKSGTVDQLEFMHCMLLWYTDQYDPSKQRLSTSNKTKQKLNALMNKGYKHLSNEFYSISGKGSISWEELASWLKRQQWVEEDDNATALNIFKGYDHDHSNSIEIDEFIFLIFNVLKAK